MSFFVFIANEYGSHCVVFKKRTEAVEFMNEQPNNDIVAFIKGDFAIIPKQQGDEQ